MSKKKLTAKQQIFIDEYLKCWNASEAARRAKYTGNAHTIKQMGVENLSKPIIKAEIEARLNKSAMSANEVLSRLARLARGDLGEFEEVLDGSVSLADHPLSYLVKKVKRTARTDENGDKNVMVEIELHDAHNALRDLGKHHALFVDRKEITGADGGPLRMAGLEEAAKKIWGKDTDTGN